MPDGPARLFQRAHGANGDEVAGGKNAIERHAPAEQFAHRLIARLLGGDGADLQGGVWRLAVGDHGGTGAAIAVVDFGGVAGGFAQKSDAAAALRDKMRRRQFAAQPIVAADRGPRRLARDRAPAHVMGALMFEQGQLFAVGFVIAIAQQHDAIGLAAVFVIDMPVARQLLKRGQKVIAMLGAGPRN